MPRSCTVLVVDDEPLIRLSLAMALEDKGCRTYEAGSAAEAIAVLEKNRDIAVVFTDIQMPGTMDGIALALAAVRDFPDLTILLMTGYADQRERAHGLDAIIHDVIAKPFTVGALRATINEALAVRARS